VKPFPYQVEGSAFLQKKRRGILADEMGLGKTVQAILALNEKPPGQVLIVAPASVVDVWDVEFHRWGTPFKRDVMVVRTGKDVLPESDSLVVVASYSLFSKVGCLDRKWDCVIFDEAHFLQGRKSQRTIAAKGLYARTIWMLTGPPMRSRPANLWSLLNILDRENYKNYHACGIKFCDAKREFVPGRGYIWNYDGKSNQEELNEILYGKYMLRRTKKQVMDDLPDKTIQYVSITNEAIARAERSSLNKIMEEYEDDGVSVLGRHIAELRRETAMRKLHYSIDFIENLLVAVDKVIVFCYHRCMMEELTTRLKKYHPVAISGSTPGNKRQRIVKNFQEKPKHRVFIGQIEAAGTGITLTAASHVVFVESSWVPSDNAQAEARPHRIGQKNPVNVYYLNIKGSIDDRVTAVCQGKEKTTREIIEYLKEN